MKVLDLVTVGSPTEPCARRTTLKSCCSVFCAKSMFNEPVVKLSLSAAL